MSPPSWCAGRRTRVGDGVVARGRRRTSDAMGDATGDDFLRTSGFGLRRRRRPRARASRVSRTTIASSTTRNVIRSFGRSFVRSYVRSRARFRDVADARDRRRRGRAPSSSIAVGRGCASTSSPVDDGRMDGRGAAPRVVRPVPGATPRDAPRRFAWRSGGQSTTRGGGATVDSRRIERRTNDAHRIDPTRRRARRGETRPTPPTPPTTNRIRGDCESRRL